MENTKSKGMLLDQNKLVEQLEAVVVHIRDILPLIPKGMIHTSLCQVLLSCQIAIGLLPSRSGELSSDKVRLLKRLISSGSVTYSLMSFPLIKLALKGLKEDQVSKDFPKF